MYGVMNDKRYSTADLKAVLQRYNEGKATADEQQIVEAWYAAIGAEEQALTPEQRAVLSAELLTGIHKNIPVKRFRWLSVAAVLLAATITGLLFFNKKKVEKPDMQLIATAAGEKKAVQLSDGTKINLNAGTQLYVPADYGKKERKVKLQGEAFFEVAQDASHPFSIESDSTVTTVLGTSFNIRSYDGFQIAVASGTVKISDAVSGKTLAETLTANKQLIRADNHTTISDINVGIAGAWRSNIFYFNNNTIYEIGEELERQYNIKVIVNGTATGHYNISFSREPLSKVLKVLAGLTGIEYQLKEDKVIIYTQKTS
jgi:transmembrane sensor